MWQLMGLRVNDIVKNICIRSKWVWRVWRVSIIIFNYNEIHTLTAEHFIGTHNKEAIFTRVTLPTNHIRLTDALSVVPMTGSRTPDSSESGTVAGGTAQRVGELHVVVIVFATVARRPLDIGFTVATVLVKWSAFKIRILQEEKKSKVN